MSTLAGKQYRIMRRAASPEVKAMNDIVSDNDPASD
jgi:hypothetical protein